MRLGVLGAAESWYLRDLQRAAGPQHEVASLAFTRLSAAVGMPGGPTAHSGSAQLLDFDAVLVRAMPPGTLEQVVFRMDLLAQYEAAGGVAVNSARAIEAAVDKYLALAKLQAAGVPVPRTVACQTREDAMAAFQQLGGDVVVKPLFGAEGRGITRLNDEALAWRAFSMLEHLGAVLYLQEFLAHDGFDLRLLVIGSEVLAMKRSNPTDWRTNICRGAKGEEYIASHEQIDLALRAARAVGASLAGVDLLPTHDGRLFVLEVNAAPGWKGLARATHTDVAARVLAHLERCVQGKGGVAS
jgi:ribosomal protein S6--L-glutamate ligase